MRIQNYESLIAQIENARRQMHELIDQEYDNFLLRLNSEEILSTDCKPVYLQRTLPLYSSPSMFKRQKPVSITFDDGRTIAVPTWKTAVTEIMKECNSDPVMHARLMDIREKVMGKQRTILSASPDGMDVPLKIDDELYMEGKYDAETMIYVATERVLRAIGYDYSNIKITIRDPSATYIPQEHVEETLEEDTSPSMCMQM